MSTTTTLGEAVNFKKNVGENPVKRTFAKIRHPVRAGISGKTAERAQDEEVDDEGEQHQTTEDYAGSLGRGIVKEALHYCNSQDGDENLRQMYGTISEVVSEVTNQFLVSDELKKVTHMAGQELVGGVSEGLAMTLVPYWQKVPTALTAPILLLVSIFVGLFSLGLLLALWRFSLFGLQ